MFYLAFPTKNESCERLVGSSWQIFIDDLKTVRGILSRYSGWIKRAKSENRRVEIYRLARENIYKDFDKYYSLVYIDK